MCFIKHLAVLSFTALIVLSGCKSYFRISDFNNRTAEHKTIAILPFEIQFTGKKPKELSESDIRKVEDAESKAFMISFYNEVLESTKRGRKSIRVDIQHYDKTIHRLNEKGLDIRSTWEADPGVLAEMLGVDAVVNGRIEKHRLMSDLASYGIDLGVHIIHVLSDYAVWPWLPADATKSKDVKTNYSLIDSDGIVLWSIAYDVEADWRQTSNEIIDHINHKSAKHFPYRSKQ
jgi:hypothetical protein